MAFRAVHEQWGTVFAHLPDLGCGRSWADVHRVRPPAPLRCDECRHPMRAKVSPTKLRFFAHAPGAPDCAAAGESLAHHLLKLELATAARAAGAEAEMEVRGPAGAWRADVMASDPAGAWRIALEAQLSPIPPEEIQARAARMSEDGVRSVWFSDRPRPPWLGRVPSVRLERGEDGGLLVAEGLAKFAGDWWEQGPRAPLTQFLQWVFAGRVVPHRRKRPVSYPLEPRTVLWTAPSYIRAENAFLLEAERRAREDEQRRRQQEQHRANIEALLERQAALRGPAVRFVREETGTTLTPFADEPDPAFAMGVPVYLGDRPYAVICPVAGRMATARDRLDGLVLIVASETEQRRVAAQAAPKQRVVVLEPDPEIPALIPRQAQPDSIMVRQAVTHMLGLDRM
ncbi:competence protein CoiA family protein [Streptomyces thermogriseus]|uniref:Competence protein CoiA nuclease-like domain-containing protein n=1 Tax=Streptomyces thermogriseus TaxID=75292 RepID=A0ABN1T6Z9_9ACTN